ncbi:MAG: DNA cytosine methyltransferase [Verrucomicrobium sp.]|nr:DNA cytosine methyltransferase [Verrucomicrobium sp.]
MSRAYYNEIEPYAAKWLRNLIAARHIAPGDVDERDVRDVRPADLGGYTQCHFFAGIGVWSAALRGSGWPDDVPVWTASCPCQPFSSAGRGLGFDDERHLWPHFFHLVRVCRPGVLFGEQVEKAIGFGWLDLVQDDLEGEGYAFGAVGFPAASVGAPHIRSRIYWMANANLPFPKRFREVFGDGKDQKGLRPGSSSGGVPDLVADSKNERRKRLENSAESSGGGGSAQYSGELGNPISSGLEIGSVQNEQQRPLRIEGAALIEANPLRGFWGNAEWIWCRDGKYRPVEPGTFPLAHGAASRVGRLRAYGNAINKEQAQAFIRAYLDLERGR